MKLQYETWSNKKSEELTDYFLDYTNINFFTPFWMKFSVIESSETQVIFSVKTPLYKMHWKSLIEKTQFGFIDRLQSGPFHSFIHQHEFIPFKNGTIIKDTLSIELTKSKLINSLLAPFITFFLNIAFEDRETKSYDLLFNQINLRPYTAIENRISETMNLYESSGLKYFQLYAHATKLLEKYKRLLPNEYDIINNEIYRAIIEIKSTAKSQEEQLDDYLYWEQKTIVSPLLAILLKKHPLKRVYSRFFIYINLSKRIFFFSKSFNQEKTRIKFTKLLLKKLA
jgi:ligand-binding SRPBCC domain-containing protein